VDVVEEHERPVPLHHLFYIGELGVRELKSLKGMLHRPRHKRRVTRDGAPRHPIPYVISEGWLPALYFAFSRLDCERLCARQARETDLLTKEERRDVLRIFDDLARLYEVDGHPATERLRRMAMKGSLYHHAGLLPIYKEIVERLFTTANVKMLFATETFALGVNMPAKCVIFDKLRKFDGVEVRYMKTRDYQQMAGRAGRQGLDDEGLVLSRIRLDDANWAALQRITEGQCEPVISRFNLAYSTLLNLYNRLGQGVYNAYDRSFAHYQQSKSEKKSLAPRNRIIARRMGVLKTRGYIDGDELSPRGKLARMINGYEIQVTEFYFLGILERATVIELVALFTAIVYEPRKMDDTDQTRIQCERECLDAVRDWRREEKQKDLANLTKRPDFGLNLVAIRWAKGASFDEVLKLTTAPEGDLVRTFRMALQLMRQLGRVLDKEDELRSKLHDAASLMDRDVVDARRQLELG
jgi:superfamily II RNA helicase